jgi:hypothetical protein
MGNVSLISQALEGQLPSKDAVGIHRGHSGRLRERRREDRKPPSIDGAVRGFFLQDSAAYSFRSPRENLRPRAKSGGFGF